MTGSGHPRHSEVRSANDSVARCAMHRPLTNSTHRSFFLRRVYLSKPVPWLCDMVHDADMS